MIVLIIVRVLYVLAFTAFVTGMFKRVQAKIPNFNLCALGLSLWTLGRILESLCKP